MKYSVNPSVLGSMLAVPSVVAESHLKLASADQLKVLLAFFKYVGTDDYIENITAATGVRAADVVDCLDYWASCGVLMCDGKPTAAADKPAIAKAGAVSGKPTREEAVRRAKNDDELKYLFSEIQCLLSREVTTAQMCSLVWLHDTYGLPASVILMAVQYSINEGRKNFSYIEKVCIDWAENDVVDVPSAERRLNQLYLSKSAWKIVCSAFGIDDRRPSAKESKFADRWVNEYGFTKQMLKIAYDRAIDSIGKLNFTYIGKILDKWHADGINKPEQLSDNGSDKKQRESKKSETSYDIEKIKSQFNDFDNLGW